MGKPSVRPQAWPPEEPARPSMSVAAAIPDASCVVGTPGPGPHSADYGLCAGRGWCAGLTQLSLLLPTGCWLPSVQPVASPSFPRR